MKPLKITIFKICTCISYFICLRYGSITSAALHFSWALRSTLSLPLIFHLFDLAFVRLYLNLKIYWILFYVFIIKLSHFCLCLKIHNFVYFRNKDVQKYKFFIIKICDKIHENFNLF
jgi:hypothetical protein